MPSPRNVECMKKQESCCDFKIHNLKYMSTWIYCSSYVFLIKDDLLKNQFRGRTEKDRLKWNHWSRFSVIFITSNICVTWREWEYVGNLFSDGEQIMSCNPKIADESRLQEKMSSDSISNNSLKHTCNHYNPNTSHDRVPGTWRVIN